MRTLSVMLAAAVLISGCNAPATPATPAAPAAAQAAPLPSAPVAPAPKTWVYGDEHDPMSGKSYHWAALDSLNEVKLRNAGTVHGTLMVKDSDQAGLPLFPSVDVLFSVSGGHPTCWFAKEPEYSTCGLRIRMDEKLSVYPFWDHRKKGPDTMEMHPLSVDRFRAGLDKAKKVLVEAYFPDGPQVFEFHPQGLIWPAHKS